MFTYPPMRTGPPEVGTRLGKGSFAQVYEVPGQPGLVLKRTTCSASIELLRSLMFSPQPGFPLVHEEVFEEDNGATWFLLEELYMVDRFDVDVAVVMQAMDDTYRKVGAAGRDSFSEADVSELCANNLRTKGYEVLADAFAHLGNLLTGMDNATLDIRLANLMRDERNRLVLSDPICTY